MGQYITDITVITGKDAIPPTDYFFVVGPDGSKYDLNKGAGGADSSGIY